MLAPAPTAGGGGGDRSSGSNARVADGKLRGSPRKRIARGRRSNSHELHGELFRTSSTTPGLFTFAPGVESNVAGSVCMRLGRGAGEEGCFSFQNLLPPNKYRPTSTFNIPRTGMLKGSSRLLLAVPGRPQRVSGRGLLNCSAGCSQPQVCSYAGHGAEG